MENTRLSNLVYSHLCEFFEYFSPQDILSTKYAAFLRIGIYHLRGTYTCMSKASPRISILCSLFLFDNDDSIDVNAHLSAELTALRSWIGRLRMLLSLLSPTKDEIKLQHFVGYVCPQGLGCIPPSGVLPQVSHPHRSGVTYPEDTSVYELETPTTGSHGEGAIAQKRGTVPACRHCSTEMVTTISNQMMVRHSHTFECGKFCAPCVSVFERTPITRCSIHCVNKCLGSGVGWYPHSDLDVWLHVHAGEYFSLPASVRHTEANLSLRQPALPNSIVSWDFWRARIFLQSMIQKVKADIFLESPGVGSYLNTLPLYYQYSGNSVVRDTTLGVVSRILLDTWVVFKPP